MECANTYAGLGWYSRNMEPRQFQCQASRSLEIVSKIFNVIVDDHAYSSRDHFLSAIDSAVPSHSAGISLSHTDLSLNVTPPYKVSAFS